MKQINKNQEPRVLLQYRASAGTFGNIPANVQTALKQSLLDEQGYICCYCMKRIPQTLRKEEIDTNTPDCKIEHFKCQAGFEDQELNYQNLLLACHGNHGFPRFMQTCDTFKGNTDLTYNPSNRERNIESLIKYRANGEIYSDDEILNSELTKVLNLNTKDLQDIRQVFYKSIQNRIILEGKRRNGLDIQKRFYESEKERLLTKFGGKFTQYCMIGVYLINKKLNHLN